MNVSIKFEPRDLWVGVYWKHTQSIESRARWLDVYVCVLPMFPIQFSFAWGWKRRDPDYERHCRESFELGVKPMPYRVWKRYAAGAQSEDVSA